jgi:hypothetical protein
MKQGREKEGHRKFLWKKNPLWQRAIRRPKDDRITKADIREVGFEAGM